MSDFEFGDRVEVPLGFGEYLEGDVKSYRENILTVVDDEGTVWTGAAHLAVWVE
ncbi:MAG: hypothetical protein QGG90_10330 [Nitrospinota bacterium]|jgi:hypothetical protein|nr:hypothetical protein [Nitrospinota bacterium]